jgi:hypothetical protein
MMKRMLFGALMVAVIMASCSEGGKNTGGNSAPVKVDSLAKAEKPSDGKDDLRNSSVMRYAMGTPDLAAWGLLLNRSKWAKDVHNGQYTFLCPSEAVLKDQGNIMMQALKLPENQVLLDKTMASHLLSEPLSYDKLMLVDEVKTIDGQTLKIDHNYATIAGIPFTRREAVTQHGSLIVIDGIINFSEAQIKELNKKEQKKRATK